MQNANPFEPARPESPRKSDFEVLPLDAQLRKQMGLPADLLGVVVSKLKPESEAYKQGLACGGSDHRSQSPKCGRCPDYAQLNQMGTEKVLLLNLIRNQQSLIVALKLP